MRKILVIALIAAVAATAHGMFLEEGTSEISLSGMVDFDTLYGTYTDLNIFYGYFFMDYLEIGLSGGYINDNSVRVWELGPKAEYNFDIGYSVVPFVGGALKFASSDAKDTDRSKDAAVAALDVGAKFFITEYAAISVALVGEVATDDIYMEGDGDTSTSDARAELGMRFFF
jgi:hypothetical protein